MPLCNKLEPRRPATAIGPAFAHRSKENTMERNTPDDLTDQSREGRYANFFKVGHNAFEVILDFGQFFEGDEAPRMHTRILMSPVYSRALLNLLQEWLVKYQQTFGEIPAGEFHE
jgi:Protein of unknown function (DUF3467)